MSLPAADDLFRPTVVPNPEELAVADPPRDEERPDKPVAVAPAGHPDQDTATQPDKARTHSGRVKHDEKMTVYVTSDELLDLEHARLTLRRELGLAVDRGRLVRAAVAIALADLDENGEHSDLVRRLGQA